MVVQRNKAIVGRNAFAHEAGIHQDGMLKERTTYEIMRPEDVGFSQTDLGVGQSTADAQLSPIAPAISVTMSPTSNSIISVRRVQEVGGQEEGDLRRRYRGADRAIATRMDVRTVAV